MTPSAIVPTFYDLFTTGNFVVGSKFRLYGIKDVPA